MVIRLVSDLDQTSVIDVDGKLFGEDVKAVYFTHDCKKPYDDSHRLYAVIEFDDGTVWDTSKDKEPPGKPAMDGTFKQWAAKLQRFDRWKKSKKRKLLNILSNHDPMV